MIGQMSKTNCAVCAADVVVHTCAVCDKNRGWGQGDFAHLNFCRHCEPTWLPGSLPFPFRFRARPWKTKLHANLEQKVFSPLFFFQQQLFMECLSHIQPRSQGLSPPDPKRSEERKLFPRSFWGGEVKHLGNEVVSYFLRKREGI